jgi:hypothetical protein
LEFLNEYRESLNLIEQGLHNNQNRINKLDYENDDYFKDLYFLQVDKSKLHAMKRDLQRSIQWMETAREPGSRQGIDNIKAIKSYW